MPQAVQVDCPELIVKDPYDLVLGPAGKTEGKVLHFRGNFNYDYVDFHRDLFWRYRRCGSGSSDGVSCSYAGVQTQVCISFRLSVACFDSSNLCLQAFAACAKRSARCVLASMLDGTEGLPTNRE